MRIYYAVEAEGLRLSRPLRPGGGLEKAWNRFNRRIHEWRRGLESRYGIPADLGLRPGELACRPRNPAPAVATRNRRPSQGVGGDCRGGCDSSKHFAVEYGGVKVTNICLDKDEVTAYRRVSLDRLFNRVNATAAQDGALAFVIFGQQPEEMVTGLYQRLRSYNPVPARHGPRDDGWHTHNLPIERVIGGPAFRDPDGDCLLQASGSRGPRPPLAGGATRHRRETPTALAGAFGILDRSLNRRAARNDPRGVVRR